MNPKDEEIKKKKKSCKWAYSFGDDYPGKMIINFEINKLSHTICGTRLIPNGFTNFKHVPTYFRPTHRT